MTDKKVAPNMTGKKVYPKCKNVVYTSKSYPKYFVCGKACREGHELCSLCSTEGNEKYRETCDRCGSEYGQRSYTKCTNKYEFNGDRNHVCGKMLQHCNACHYTAYCGYCDESWTDWDSLCDSDDEASGGSSGR